MLRQAQILSFIFLTVNAHASKVFPVEDWMEPAVEFWAETFTRFPEETYLIHDAQHVQVIYEIVNTAGASRTEAKEQVRRRVDFWKKRLRLVSHKRMNELSPSELNLYAQLAGVGERKFTEVAKRVRVQRGLKRTFAKGVRRSGRYLPMIKKVFLKYGVPLELARLPLVESSFATDAESHAGALGIWQFIRTTGRQYLNVGSDVDERRDPARSTEAAAKYLKQAYLELGSWPLALMAYQFGIAGIKRARAQVGSSKFVDIWRGFKDPQYRFASRNYYLEFLAALRANERVEVKKDVAEQAVNVRIPHYISYPRLLKYLKWSAEAIGRLNPALSAAVKNGTQPIPRGYRLRIPGKWSETGSPRVEFWNRYRKIPDFLKRYDKSPR